MHFRMFSVFLMTCQGTRPLSLAYFFLCMKAGEGSFGVWGGGGVDSSEGKITCLQQFLHNLIALIKH